MCRGHGVTSPLQKAGSETMQLCPEQELHPGPACNGEGDSPHLELCTTAGERKKAEDQHPCKARRWAGEKKGRVRPGEMLQSWLLPEDSVGLHRLRNSDWSLFSFQLLNHKLHAQHLGSSQAWGSSTISHFTALLYSGSSQIPGN